MERVKKPRRSERSAASADAVASLQDASVTAPAEVPVVQFPATAAPQVTAPVASKFTSPTVPVVADEDEPQDQVLNGGVPLPARGVPLSVNLSRQLHGKLLRAAHDEGVTLEALVQELLAEGATLRAWEIIERKQAMRGGATGQQPPQNSGNRNFNNNFAGNGRQPGANQAGRGPGGVGNGPRSHSHHNHQRGANSRGTTNNAWMEDKAAFLEYVRNQEKRRR